MIPYSRMAHVAAYPPSLGLLGPFFSLDIFFPSFSSLFLDPCFGLPFLDPLFFFGPVYPSLPIAAPELISRVDPSSSPISV